jgi:biotin carboxylase
MISPHFPENFLDFAKELRAKGVNTLGIADEPYDNLPQVLKDNLTAYYQVQDMEDYDQVYRAVAWFAHKYGRIDRIESHNEHWLELDARLRTDFNVFGYHNEDMARIKFKSGMKTIFREIGLKVARGRVFKDAADARKLVKELGLPVIIKPDNGVGAGDTHKIKTQDELAHFLEEEMHADVTYIMEEFIAGDIVTYDGLVDKDGQVVFASSMEYSTPVVDMVTNQEDMYFYVNPNVSDELDAMGRKILKAFNTRERFFHLEFFRTATGDILPLEVNMRPPGGSSVDMMNYSSDISVFREYANVVVDGKFEATDSHEYYVCYTSRRYKNHDYRHNQDEIRAELGPAMLEIQVIPGIFADIMGDEGYLFRVRDVDTLVDHSNFIRAVK